MKLYASHTSPYARKVRILIHELGLVEQVEIITLSPMEPDARQRFAHPLNKIPALELDTGNLIYDSRVIAAYLFEHKNGPDPRDYAAETTQALIEGIIDAAVSMTFDQKRPDADASAFWLARWTLAIEEAVKTPVLLSDDKIGVTEAGMAAALGYLDFRQPQIDWRGLSPEKAAWFEKLSQRDSIVATAPPAGV